MSDTSTTPFVEAFHAGLSPIPVDTSTKRPMLRWAEFQEHPAELLRCQEWDANHANIGIVCGEVSGRLVCIDIEGAFDGGLDVAKSLVKRDLADVWERWCDGYLESTPSGGRHVLVRVEGSGPLDGNAKLASDADGVTLIETRGEGGYVIVAPSRNGARGWELLRGGFATIAWATSQEWKAVAAVLSSFDSKGTPPPPAVVAPTTPPILRLGGSWVEDELARLPSIEAVLEDHGWQPARSHDGYGQHWVRPGKEVREGHSASVSANGRLFVHSSNAGLECGNPTHDALDVILFYALGHRPSLDERVEYLQAQRPAAGQGAGAAPDRADGVADLNLPADFWESRAYLTHIRQAALSRRLSPDALWEAVKCFYAAAIPWNFRLPGDGTLDYISIVVGPSGAGKSRAKQEAYNLLAGVHAVNGIRFPAPVGSGEGMTAAYLNKADDGPKYSNRGIGWYADEAKFVLDIAARPGNTTMQAFKQGWSGELTGSVAATAERHRWLEPRDVRFTLLMSVTPGVATRFLSSDLSDEGLPQRVSWGWAVFDHDDAKPEHPGPLMVPVFDHNRSSQVYELELAADLEELVDSRQLALARGEGEGLQGHSTYATLKGAAILACLDGRMDVTMQDWSLSEQDWNLTCSIRKHLASGAQQALTDRNVAAGVARAYSRIAETDVYLERAVISLIGKVKKAKEPITMREAKDHLRHFSKRHGIGYMEVIEVAIGRGLLAKAGGGIAAV